MILTISNFIYCLSNLIQMIILKWKSFPVLLCKINYSINQASNLSTFFEILLISIHFYCTLTEKKFTSFWFNTFLVIFLTLIITLLDVFFLMDYTLQGIYYAPSIATISAILFCCTITTFVFFLLSLKRVPQGRIKVLFLRKIRAYMVTYILVWTVILCINVSILANFEKAKDIVVYMYLLFVLTPSVNLFIWMDMKKLKKCCGTKEEEYFTREFNEY